MAVTLRLARHGQRNRPFYRVVATDSQSRRDGRFIEVVGNYNVISNPPQITLKEDRIKYWLGVGAQTTDVVENIIKKTIPGYLEDLQKRRKAKIVDARKKRKERAAKKGAPKKEAKPAKTRKPAAEKKARAEKRATDGKDKGAKKK